MHRSPSFALGIDIGGTTAKLALVTSAGQIVARAQVPTGRKLGAEDLVADLATATGRLLVPITSGPTVVGVGVAAPGFRAPDGSGVVNVSNLPTLDGFPLRERLAAALGLPVIIDNDANAAALAEYRFGDRQGARRLHLVTVGTGIGSGLIVDGEVLRVSWGGLGDSGHVVVQRDGRPCACGGTGCLETLAAVPAMVRAAQAAGVGVEDFRALAAAARAGEPLALAAIREAAGWLGMGLAALTHVLGPERILLGGGATDALGDLLLEPVRASFARHCQPFLRVRVTFGRARLGNDAGVIGAAALQLMQREA
ncbi:MAG: ROK family protein [Armatimonadetes bacterium]|nr:ROK family protein [Armatimonadota bacterium]